MEPLCGFTGNLLVIMIPLPYSFLKYAKLCWSDHYLAIAKQLCPQSVYHLNSIFQNRVHSPSVETNISKILLVVSMVPYPVPLIQESYQTRVINSGTQFGLVLLVATRLLSVVD